MNLKPRRSNRWLRLIMGFVINILAYVPSILLAIILPEAWAQNFYVYEGVRLTVALTGFLLICLSMRYVDRRPLSFLRLKLDRNAVKAFFISLCLTGLIVLGVRWLGNQFIPANQLNYYEVSFSWKWLISVIVGGFIMQGFTEELIFRGYIPQTLEMKAVPTLWISSLAFAALHLHYIGSYSGLELVFELFYPFAFGFLAFILVYLMRTTWAAVAIHGGSHLFREIGDFLGLGASSLLVFVTGLVMFILALILLHFNRQRFEEGHAVDDQLSQSL